MKLYYPLVLLAAASLLASGDGAAVNSPAQVHRSVEGQTGISTQRFLRTDEAVDEDDEARELPSGTTYMLADGIKWMGSLLRGSYDDIAAKVHEVKKGTNAVTDETLTAPLLKSKLSPLVSPEELAHIKLINNLDMWLREGKPVNYVFKKLKMSQGRYDKFDMNRFSALEKYRASYIELQPLPEPPTMPEYLKNLAGEDNKLYIMLLGKVMLTSKDDVYKNALAEAFKKLEYVETPPVLASNLRGRFPNEVQVRDLLKTEHTEFSNLRAINAERKIAADKLAEEKRAQAILEEHQ